MDENTIKEIQNYNTDVRARNVYGFYLAEFLVTNGFFTDLLRIVKNPRAGYEKTFIYVFRDSKYLEEAIQFYKENLSEEKFSSKES